MSRQARAGGHDGRSATIRQIAAQLGVHASTVSRALNAATADSISEETRERVRTAAVALGYEPNPWARSLRTRRTQLLGLLIPRLSDAVIATMFEAAEDQARQHGYQAVTLSTRDRPTEERRLVDELLERRVDGLILATPIVDDPLLSDLDARDVPFVLLNRASGNWLAVRGDDEAGGYIATRHLIGQGHTRVAMIAGPDNVSTALLRRAGYERALREERIAVDPRLVVESSFTIEGGVVAGSQLMSLVRRPTAIFAVNDATAIGVMSVARDLNLDIPRDLAVVGYNDTDIAGYLGVPLSSIAIPLTEMGRRAVDTLVARLAGLDREGVVLAPRLMARASSLFDRSGA